MNHRVIGLKSSLLAGLVLFFVAAGHAHAAFEAEIAFANQIIDEINALKTETNSVGISNPHRGHLVNRLNVAKYYVKEGRIKLENNKPKKARNKFWIAKHYMTRYIRLLNRKVGKGHVSPATAQLLRPDARQIRRHLRQLIRGEVGNGVPVANAGLDQSVSTGDPVTLDGSGSSDPDGDSLSFQWTLVSQPAGSGASLNDAQTATPTLTPDLAGSYAIELVVADAEDSSAPDTVIVNASLPNTQPVANAGPDQTGVQGDLVTLDGSGSSDADGNNLSFDWTLSTLPSGSGATLDNNTAVMPTFSADQTGTYEAELTVNDGLQNSDPDTVVVNIDAANTPPVADAGPDQEVFINQIVMLDGSLSSDVDGDQLSWFWSIITKPAGSTAALVDEFEVNPTFSADVTGQYVFQLIVDDGVDESAPDSVVVNAITPNTIPIANAGFDQSDVVNASVTLDGSGSFDPDNDPITYSWSLSALPNGSSAVLDNPALPNPSFVLDLPGTYVAQLVVNDGEANSDPDLVVVTTDNSRPVAHAGADQTVTIGDPVALDGTASSDADNDPLTYAWSITGTPEGSAVALSDPASAAPTFTPDEIGFYLVQLIVSDGLLDSDPVSVTIQVNPLNNIAITLNAPAEGLVTNQSPVHFIGSLNHTGTLTINGFAVTIEPDLSFDYAAALTEGMNVFNLAAGDAVGTTDTLARLITLDTDAPDLPDTGLIIVSLPDANNQATITGDPGSVEGLSEVVIVNERTDEITIVTADAGGAFAVVVNGIQGDTYILLSEDAAGNQSGSIEINDGSLPDDPADVAPTLNPTQITSLFDGTAFLYSGADPIQTGVAPGTIDPSRTAVIRGRLKDRAGLPLPGVLVTIKDHPEYGQTLSRNDGLFDLAVNGGKPFVLHFSKETYLPIQRNIKTGTQDYFWLDDAVMIRLDPQVTTLDLLSTAPVQVARGSVETDADGNRQATLLFKQGTSAVMTLPDNSTQTLSTINVRATEYTVGDSGPDSMPAPLPATSGYTYAVELSLDEAIAANAKSVTFNQPVPVYLENFAGFTNGVRVPAGYYDFDLAAWIGSGDGRIIQITAINGTIAELDIDGDNVADDAAALAALGIDTAEQEQLASLYGAGQSLWRIPVSHFSPWDFNWPFGPQQIADFYKELIEKPIDKKCENCSKNGGSIVGASQQTLGEMEPIAGTDLEMYYQSYYQKGYLSNQTLNIPVTSANPPSGLSGVRVDVDIAGARTTVEFGSAPNQEYTFVWDGKDGYGRDVEGNATANISVRYIYPAVYYKTRDSFSQAWGNFRDGVALGGSRSSGSYTFGSNRAFVLGQPGVPSAGLGGWTLSNHHAYDAYEQSLFTGSGDEIRSDRISDTLEVIAGGGNDLIADNVDATAAQIIFGSEISPASDGGYYISDFTRIRKVTADDQISTIAGTGTTGYSGDGDPAVSAEIHLGQAANVVEDAAGNLYFADTFNSVIRKIDPDGIITTIAGLNNTTFPNLSGDGGPANDASLYRPESMVIRSDGSLIFSDRVFNQGNKLRIISPDGTIEAFAGNGSSSYSGDGGLAIDAAINSVSDLAIDSQDNVYLVSSGRVRRIDASGVIERVAGGGAVAPASAVIATDANLNLGLSLALFLAFDKQDRLYIAIGRGPAQVFRVENERLQLLAGVNDVDSPTPANHGDLALATNIGFPTSVMIQPDQSVVFAVLGKVFRIKPAFPVGFQNGSYNIASSDAQMIYQFDADGRHLRTLNAITASVIDEFSYTPDGLLDKVTDAFGNQTTIQRDANGNPLGITGPYGQVTTFSLDANGYLSAITNPLNDAVTMGYTANGLMTSYNDKNNNPYTFVYQPDGRLIDDNDPIGGGWTLDRTQVDETSYKITMTSGEGRVKEYLLGDPKEELNTFALTDSDGSTYSNQRYLDGRLSGQFADGMQVETEQIPDPRFGMQAQFGGTTTTESPAGLTLSQTRDRQVTLTDPDNPLTLLTLTETGTVNGRTSNNVYDAATNIWTQTSPENRTAIVQINSNGQPVLSQITGFNSASYSYDTRGRLQTITEGSGAEARVTTLAFYPVGGSMAGYLESITDAENQATRFEYDALGRVTKQILPDLREIQYTYDANGNLASLAPPGRPAHVFSYTGVNQESQYTPPAVTGITTPQTVYTYNLDRQLTQVTRPDQQLITMTYGTATGLLDQMATPSGSYNYSYDPTSAQLTSITAPDGEGLNFSYDGFLMTNSTATGTVSGSVDRTYDNDFRIFSRSVNGGNTITFGYDQDSLLTQAGSLTISREAQKAGLVSGTSQGNLTTSQTYNGFAEMDSFDASYNATSLYSTSYVRDKLGRITQKTETIEGATSVTNYVYDPAGRLISETTDGVTTSYTYDGNGNRTHVNGILIGSYDNQDRLITYESASYIYADNGELQSKTEGGNTIIYNYDVLGNLRSVALSDGSQIDYITDGQNRQVGKRVNGTLVQGFVYKNQLNPIAVLDGNNNIVARFIYGTRINVPDYMVKGSIIYRIISDHLGSPRLIVNIADGTIAQRLDYDSWGNIAIDTNPGFQPFGFAGGIYDQHTQLTRFGARDYDANIARWTSKDSIGFEGRETNLYGYSFRDPVNFIDLNGNEASSTWNQCLGPDSCQHYDESRLRRLCSAFPNSPNMNCARDCLASSYMDNGADLDWFLNDHPRCWIECGIIEDHSVGGNPHVP